MKKPDKSNYIIYALVILIIMFGFVYFFGLSSDKDKEPIINNIESFGGGLPGIGGNANAPIRSLDYDVEFKKWRETMKELGPARAYENFKQTFAYDHFGTQHSAAHIFGEVLFDETGIDGLVFCDSTFAFGCFHSFFGKALYVLGEDVVEDMDKVCVEKYGELGTGCQHGIGHGLLQYAGYNNLEEALDLCSHTTQKIPIFGCTSGVFMEYNVPLIDLGKGETYVTRTRELNENNPYEPCDTLPEKFRDSCYYEMAQWWDKVFFVDYKKIGELCDNIPDQEYVSSCYLGIGNVVAPTHNYDVELTKSKCELMPNDKAELICLSGASWSFFANPDYRNLAPRLCEDLSEEDKMKCAKEADLTRSFNE